LKEKWPPLSPNAAFEGDIPASGFWPQGMHASAMSATLILDDPEDTFTKRQREMLTLLAERLPDGSVLRCRHEDGGVDSSLLVYVRLAVAERIYFDAVEQDPKTAALALHEMITRSVAREMGIWVHPGEMIVPSGQRVRTRRG